MDHGSLAIENETLPLIDIIKEKGNTGYIISAIKPLQKGMEIKCFLDMDRRLRIMRLHSAQHLLSGTLRLIRKDILTSGMWIDEDVNSCTVIYPEVSGLKKSDLDQALKIYEELFNKNKKIFTEIISSEQEAIIKYGDMYRPTSSSNSLKGKIRLIIIEDLEANACGGTHVRNLSETGRININNFTKFQNGIEIKFSLQ